MMTNKLSSFSSSCNYRFAYLVAVVVLLFGAASINAESVVSSSSEQQRQASSESSSSSSVVSCPNPYEAGKFYHRYHSPTLCGTPAAQQFAEAIVHNRQLGFQRLREQKQHHLVPDQQTTVCPVAADTTSTEISGGGGDDNDTTTTTTTTTGLMTVWMVQNTASTSVVLSWVDPTTGREFSALDGSISPPQADPNAILPPGQDSIVYGYEGHVFLARELSDDGVVGPILLKHRLGLIPVGANAKNLKCKPSKGRQLLEEKKKRKPKTKVVKDDKSTSFWSMITGTGEGGASSLVPSQAKNFLTKFGFYATALVGIPLKVLGQYYFVQQASTDDDNTVVADPEPLKDDKKTLEDKYQRRVETQLIECNKVEVGFRNRSPCPLHASWVQMNHDDLDKCSEQFRFHLGIEHETVDNFMWDWKSTTKFESTFMGHQYVFRLAADPTQIVETVYLEPTKIVDCPYHKNPKNHVVEGAQQGVTTMVVEREISIANYTSSSSKEILQDATTTVTSGTEEGECDATPTKSSSSKSSKPQGSISEKEEKDAEGSSVAARKKNNNSNNQSSPPSRPTEEVNQEYQNFLEKLEGHPERMKDFLDYMRTQSNQYDKEA